MVLYHGTADTLIETLSHEPSVVPIVVDNTPGRTLDPARWNFPGLQYIPMGRNAGIGAAHNAGTARARLLACSLAVFFDQDSTPQPGYVTAITSEYHRLRLLHPALFVLGPTITDGHSGQISQSTIHKDRHGSDGFAPKREVICSGSCTSLERIETVGPEDETLFIDFVDFEWCWRANALGLISGVTDCVNLTHYVGKDIFRFLGQEVIISAPGRYRYQYRNYINLLRRRHVPRGWKINTGIKLLVWQTLYPFHTRQWPHIAGEALRGLRDGLARRSGGAGNN